MGLAPTSHAVALAAARRALDGVAGAQAARGSAAHLDPPRQQTDAPRVDRVTPLEGGLDVARVVPPLDGPLARAFLDGVQRTERAGYAGVVPIVHASCAAVVRVRDPDGRLATWSGGLVRHDAIYVPESLLGGPVLEALAATGLALRDTQGGDAATGAAATGDAATGAAATGAAALHPLALDRAALNAVRTDRSRLERTLAERWITDGDGWLWVDGPLPGDAASRAPRIFGVIKSHRTLYAEGDQLQPIFALAAGERSRVFAVDAATRVRVASWYLRLRDPAGQGPLHGLVRIEAAITEAEVSARADTISAMVLADRAPLARPDARWDVMAYPIRDAEAVLRAVL